MNQSSQCSLWVALYYDAVMQDTLYFKAQCIMGTAACFRFWLAH